MNNREEVNLWCIKWGLVVVTGLVFAFTLTGCNTVKGLAQDVYGLTEGIQNEMATDTERDGSRPNNWD